MKFKVGDKVYIKSKNIGYSLKRFMEHNGITTNLSLRKRKFKISYYDDERDFYVINGDHFLRRDLSPLEGENKQLKLF